MKHHLDPDLKRLMAWSRNDSPPPSEEAPLGFASRVVTSLNRPTPAPPFLLQLQQSAWSSVWASVVILALGFLVLLNQMQIPRPAADFSSALGFIASNLTQ